jgi:hypothetical protein
LSQMESKPWSNTNFQFWEIYIIIISYLKEVLLGMTNGVFLFLVGSIVGFITTPLLWSFFKFNLVVTKVHHVFGLRLKHFLDRKIISNYLILRSCQAMRLKSQRNYENSC